MLVEAAMAPVRSDIDAVVYEVATATLDDVDIAWLETGKLTDEIE